MAAGRSASSREDLEQPAGDGTAGDEDRRAGHKAGHYTPAFIPTCWAINAAIARIQGAGGCASAPRPALRHEQFGTENGSETPEASRDECHL